MSPRPCVSTRRFFLLVLAALAVLAVVLLALQPGSRGRLKTGRAYLRVGMVDSLLEATIRSTGGDPMAQEILVDALGRDLLVTLDQVGACRDIVEGYQATLALTPGGDPVTAMIQAIFPLPLFQDDDSKCFAYLVIYEVPTEPYARGRDLAESLPISIGVIHPASDRHLLHAP